MASAATTIDEFRDALLRGDRVQAELIALEAVAEGMAVADLYVDVMTLALIEIGAGWERGELTVADEHLATGVVESVMARVARSATRLPGRSRERVLLAGTENEGHVVGLRMLGDLAEGAGFDVVYLGAAVPVDALLDLVGRLRPRIVALSASSTARPEALAEAVEGLQRRGDVDILLGGLGVPPRLREGARVHFAPDVRDAMETIERLVGG